MIVRWVAACMLLSAAGCSSILSANELASTIRMLQLGDWGGKHSPPYTTPSQIDTAHGMGLIGACSSSIFPIVA